MVRGNQADIITFDLTNIFKFLNPRLIFVLRIS